MSVGVSEGEGGTNPDRRIYVFMNDRANASLSGICMTSFARAVPPSDPPPMIFRNISLEVVWNVKLV